MKHIYTIAGLLLATISLLLIPFEGSAQQWLSTAAAPGAEQAARIEVRAGHYCEFDKDAAYVALSAGSTQVALPIPDGGEMLFSLSVNTTMHPELAGKFPEVLSYNVKSVPNANYWGKLSVTPQGLSAMIFRPGKATWYIDPVFEGGAPLHVSYFRDDFITSKTATCYIPADEEKVPPGPVAKLGQPYNSCDLRTYRLAVAATGEYTIFHGGTVELSMAAIVTTMNRVNGIYERDFSVTMTLIPNNEQLVYTDPATDPYSNGNAFAMLGENQANITAVIGEANYDIGHVFGTNSGGVAGFGVVCNNNQKARGVTGSGAPIGDPFDVDYVAHEIGHQFAASHSFNNACGGNRSDAHAVEPGSGSSIMAYAGICNPNVQSNSDDHFHGINMRQIGLKVSTDFCPVITPLANTAPAITALDEEIFIPISTPFALTAQAFDLEGDPLTWCWEQMDNEITQQPPLATAVAGPNFRSRSPIESPTRYFPILQSVAQNQNPNWERLPSVGRLMNFRVSVRDNAAEGGCTQFADIQVNTVDGAGPFVVTHPNTPGIVWQGLSYQTVTWDVANTTAAPVNAPEVDIYLSVNGGLAFSTLIAQNVPNNGAHTIQVPNVATTLGRIIVISSQGTFFDMSNFNFTITTIDDGFAFEAPQLTAQYCQGDDISFSLVPVAVGSFANLVNLTVSETPPGSTAELSATEVAPGESVTVTLTGTANVPGGVYNLSITGEGDGFENTISFENSIINTNPQPPALISPADGATGVSINALLQWDNNASLTETYGVQVASDPGFGQIVYTAAGLSGSQVLVAGLDDGTTYYWRLTNSSLCGASEPSEAFSFTTFSCVNNAGTGLPQTIPASVEASASAVITLTGNEAVGNVRLSNVQGQHPNLSELLFQLTSPSGTTVQLASGVCGLEVTLFGNQTIEVTGPASVAGTYTASVPGGFGPGISSLGVSGTAVLADDGSADATLCDEPMNASALQGNIAIAYRGGCTFATKVLNAQNAGAIAAIIINNTGTGVQAMGGASTEVNIPSVMISLPDGQLLLNALNSGSGAFNFGFDDFSLAGNVPCPANAGGIYQPSQPLSAFVGEAVAGNWNLEVVNLSGQAQGTLTGWNLDICLGGVFSSVGAAQVGGRYTVYPNPTRDRIKIAYPPSHAPTNITLYDLSGRMLYSAPVQESEGLQIDLSRYSDGMYIMQVFGKDGAETFRIVKGS